ncbi:heme exporter protein CcmD [Ruegeria pomeroyi]|nr:heme exporter protein CcmD [Ruegeria pomeroyi]
MIPDLGKYAATVLSAYGASLVLLIGLVALSLRRGRKLRAEMEKIEQRMSRNG